VKAHHGREDEKYSNEETGFACVPVGAVTIDPEIGQEISAEFGV